VFLLVINDPTSSGLPREMKVKIGLRGALNL
jgi:hypothetical protein